MADLAAPETPTAEPPARATLPEFASLFLRLGLTAFGGPAVHIAIMEAEVVRRRRWVSSERFLDLLGAANLIPGPSSTELALFIGLEHCGWRGLAVAGACFILPAAAMVGALAWAYVRFGALPEVSGVLYGIKPVVIAVVVQALTSLAPKALKRSWSFAAIGLVGCAAAALGADALVVLLGAGLLAAALRGQPFSPTRSASLHVPGALAAGSATAVATSVSLGSLFVLFLKIGTVVFGSGYVLLAFLRDDLVTRLHWLTETQLLDAVAVGQVTPGPVFTTATFVGYLVKGWPGAVVATVGIFLPGFLLVAATRPLLLRVRQSRFAGAFLDGVNVGSLALIAVVAVQLAHAALVDVPTVVLAAVSALLLVRFKVNSTWLVLGGAALGSVARGL